MFTTRAAAYFLFNGTKVSLSLLQDVSGFIPVPCVQLALAAATALITTAEVSCEIFLTCLVSSSFLYVEDTIQQRAKERS
jgi:hypothetical protein